MEPTFVQKYESLAVETGKGEVVQDYHNGEGLLSVLLP
jgi:hypothetical protein